MPKIFYIQYYLKQSGKLEENENETHILYQVIQ